ncbi:hypothetical protein OG216_15270 [Streptomycetaceae bacterium NBC_01309]
MTRDGGGDEAAIRALLGGIDPAGAPEYAELLRAPVPALSFDAEAGPARARRVRRFSWRVRWALAGVVAVFAGAGGVAVGWDDWAARPEHKNSMRCYSDTDLSRGDEFHGTHVSYGRSGNATAHPGTQLLDICSSMWRNGSLAPGVHLREGDPESNLPVPPILVCVVDGYVSGIPAFHGETCASLKLRAWSAG